MASKSGALSVVLPDTKQLAQLPKFAEAIEQISNLDQELSVIEEAFRDTPIRDRAAFNAADALNKRTKEIVKEAETLCEPYKNPLRKWLDLVQGQFNRIKTHREQLRSIIEPKLDIFSREEAAQAKAEQDRIQKELNKQYRNSDEHVPKVKVAPNVRSGRTYYYAECIDKKKFLKWVMKEVAHGNIGVLEFIDVNTSKLREKAADYKDSKKTERIFPGVRAWEEKSF